MTEITKETPERIKRVEHIISVIGAGLDELRLYETMLRELREREEAVEKLMADIERLKTATRGRKPLLDQIDTLETENGALISLLARAVQSADEQHHCPGCGDPSPIRHRDGCWVPEAEAIVERDQ